VLESVEKEDGGKRFTNLPHPCSGLSIPYFFYAAHAHRKVRLQKSLINSPTAGLIAHILSVLLQMSQFRLTTQSRRTIVSVLFGLTFMASVATVSASNVLPCPARPNRHGYADSLEKDEKFDPQTRVTVAPRPRRRWIEEKTPSKLPNQTS
jgi:cytochrome c oxidase assembly factor 2